MNTIPKLNIGKKYSNTHFTRTDKTIAVIGGIGLLVAALSQTSPEKKVADSVGSTVNSGVEYADNFLKFGTYANQTYIRKEQTLKVSATPLELSGGNPFVAEYIRLGAGVLSVKDGINPGKTVAVLVKNEHGTPGYKLMAELEASK